MTEDLVSGTWVPPVDVAETQDKILVRAEVPGIRQEDISIEFENGLLTLRGERKPEKTEGVTWHRVERIYGNFSRSFTLPRSVDPERITASYREGILEGRGAEARRGEAEAHQHCGEVAGVRRLCRRFHTSRGARLAARVKAAAEPPHSTTS